jgi:trehalose 6-phosphate phosphatase
MVTQPIANEKAMGIFASLDPKTIAILLDVDGTMIDIGPSPFEVHVSLGLQKSLTHLFELTGGALALVSGRPIRDLDRLFSPLKLPAIGGHGAEMRVGGEKVMTSGQLLPGDLRGRLAKAALLDAGIEVEDKGYSLALHYRKAPQHQEWLLRQIAADCKAFPGEKTEVLPGKSMFEVKRPAVNKGESVRQLMKLAPFSGRMPVFIGDDVTDESVFEVMPDLGGKGFSVTRQFPGLTGIFDSPAQVRRALRLLAGQNLADEDPGQDEQAQAS